jgi:two-component system sensor histidine kinase CreC
VEHLVRALTHELKSPLTAIGGAAELLHDPLPDADRQRFAQQIGEQVDRLRTLIDRLLELSKLEHRQALENLQTMALQTRVDAVLQAHSARLQQKQIKVICERSLSSGSKPMIKAEAELVDMAIGNLLDNAVSFAPVGSDIHVSMAEASGHVSLSIRDAGPGVPPYALARLGERFYSTARPAESGAPEGRKGSGLGLAIVKRIMQLHGGHLTLVPHTPGFEARLVWPSAACADFTPTSHSPSGLH